MPDEYLECRVGNHLFRWRGALLREYVREWRAGRVRDMIHAVEKCERCGGLRHSYRERFDQNQVVAMYYAPADGYSNPVEGEGPIPRHVAYLELVRRYPPAGE